MPTLEFFFYGFTLWLGAYLLARDSQKITVPLTGWGLIAYALALAIHLLFQQFILIILLAPPLLWIGAALDLLPEGEKARPILIRIWILSSIPLAILTLVNPWFAGLIVLALMSCAGMIAKLALNSSRSPFRNTFALLAVIGLFVTLSAGLLILPLSWIPTTWIYKGGDLRYALNYGEIRFPVLQQFLADSQSEWSHKGEPPIE